MKYSLDLEVLHAPVVDHLPGDLPLGREVEVDVDQKDQHHRHVERGQAFPTWNKNNKTFKQCNRARPNISQF